MPDVFSLRLALGRLMLGMVVAAGAVAAAPVTTHAQATATVPTDTQLLEDFTHYVTVANIELANASGQAILDRKLDPRVFTGLVEDSPTRQERFERAYGRAILMPDLEAVASGLNRLYEEGRRSRARDPQEIDRNIALLTGAARGRLLAQQRLAFAGEYAVPQLLAVLQERKNQLLSTEVSALLGLMGRQSVQPLCAALLAVDPATQELICRVLERIAYPSALPYLTDLHRTTSNERVRAAAERAIMQLGGSTSGDVSVAALYRDLAEQYYKEPRSLTSFPGESHQLFWTFDPSLGLQPTGVRSEVFHEAMTMRLCERVLTLDASDQEAISLWLAANFSREIDGPEGYDNPAYPSSRREAMYFAVAAGAEATQRVLARALADRDTKLARMAIEALSRSAGASGLAGPEGVALVDALRYPDRRVRYEAALALGRANPRTAFAGSERVVPTLAGITGDSTKNFALVLATDVERQQALRSMLENSGYIVLAPGATIDDVSASIAEAPSVDVIVTDLASETTVEMIDQARKNARLQATPLLAFMSASGITRFANDFQDDRLTSLVRQGITSQQFDESMKQLIERTTGSPITEEEAASYASAGLDVLHDIAIGSSTQASGASAFDIADATVPLVAALERTRAGVRLQVADVLSFIPRREAQVSLMDAVMKASGPERLAMMVKLNASARRFGNLLDERQVRWLVDLAAEGADEDATVAASLIGALNLPNAQLVPLIVGRAE